MNLESARVSVRPLGRQWRIARYLLVALWLLAPVLMWLAPDLGLVRDVAFCWTPAALLTVTGILLSLRSSAFLAGARRGGRRGSVAVVDEVLVLRLGSRERTFRCDAIASGWVEAERVVLVTLDGAEIAVALADPAAGQALLHAVGVAPEQRRVKLVVQPPEPWIARVFGFAFAFVIAPAFVASLVTVVVALLDVPRTGAAPAALMGALCAVVSGLMVLVLVQRLPSTALSIGADGILVERLLRKRLLRRADLLDAVANGPSVALLLRSGKPVIILASPEGARAVSRRIREALAPTEAPASPTASLARLDRQGRDVGAWLVELRALGRDASGYRQAAVDASALLELVKDGAAPAERRIAAAVVLAQRDEGAARAALRIAVDTCVDERVRGVMERAADGEVEAAEVEAAVRRA